MKPLVIEYLRLHSLRQLEDDHGVCSRLSAGGDKLSLNYDQILVKNGDLIAEQCRGMVIRPAKRLPEDDWKDARVGEVELLAWPMNRFYNHGDPAGAMIDWSDPGLRVYEKLDGTCIIVYWDPAQDRWHAATRGVPEADLPIRKDDLQIGDMTFSGLFFKALIASREASSGQKLGWNPDGFDKVVHLNKELTYVFELTSPHNRVVVKYDEPRVHLLAARHTASGREVSIEDLRLQHVGRPQTWGLREPTALVTFIDCADPAKLEGAVVVDSKFNRLKIKNKAWVMSSRAKDMVTVSPRSALECIILGELDDVIPLVEKDIGDKLLHIQDSFLKYCKSIDANVALFREEAGTSRKRFAEQVMLSGDWTAPYFNLWENRSRNALDWIRKTCEGSKLSNSSLDVILSKLDRLPLTRDS